MASLICLRSAIELVTPPRDEGNRGFAASGSPTGQYKRVLSMSARGSCSVPALLKAVLAIM
ncbi:hypothetical protein D3C81_1044350 [compost metagenome]